MRVEVKFCGLTRASDAALGATLGAGFLGVVFAESPRRVDVEGALRVFQGVSGVPSAPRRVGVFGAAPVADIARTAREAGLDAVQLHGDPTIADVCSLRDAFGGEIWAARRIARDELPSDLDELKAAADRVLLDARPPDGSPLGGAGRAFHWEVVAPKLGRDRLPKLVLAGGLTPDNVGWAIDLFAPGIVDVSSGVEQSPGIKDEALMRAFVLEVRGKDR